MTESHGDPLAVVSISGGKDSNATAILAILAYGRERVRLIHADTGNEHPITERYIRDYLPGALGLPIEIVRGDFAKEFARKRLYIEQHWAAKGVDAATIDRALAILHPTGNPFLDLCMWKGRFPSRKAQFCTEELKRNPLDKYMIALAKSGHNVESWQGVRRDESMNRRGAQACERHDAGWWIRRPIVSWTAEQTFELMRHAGVEPNPLYSQGMGRVGCMPCINCNKDELREIAMRWPEQVDRIREWESIVEQASKRGLASFFFMEATGGGDLAESAMNYAAANSVDQVVSWAMTSRGGKQLDLERIIPSPECSSRYGLCE